MSELQEIRKHLWLLQIAQPYFEPTNVYLFRNSSSVLIDSGHALFSGHLVADLKSIGLDPGSLDQIVTTHPHPDHFGGAARLLTHYSIPHAVHHALLSVDAFREQYSTTVQAMLDEIYAEVFAFQKLFTRADLKTFASSAFPFPDAPCFTIGLKDGDRLTIGDVHLTVLEIPGHNPWHIALYDEESGVLFSGDSMLRGGTPLIGAIGDNHRDYLKTLDRLEEIDCHCVLPGHGRPFDSSKSAVRLARRFYYFIENSILRHLSEPLSAYEISCRVFGHFMNELQFAVICYARIRSNLQWLIEQGAICVDGEEADERGLSITIYRRV